MNETVTDSLLGRDDFFCVGTYEKSIAIKMDMLFSESNGKWYLSGSIFYQRTIDNLNDWCPNKYINYYEETENSLDNTFSENFWRSAKLEIVEDFTAYTQWILSVIGKE